MNKKKVIIILFALSITFLIGKNLLSRGYTEWIGYSEHTGILVDKTHDFPFTVDNGIVTEAVKRIHFSSQAEMIAAFTQARPRLGLTVDEENNDLVWDYNPYYKGKTLPELKQIITTQALNESVWMQRLKRIGQIIAVGLGAFLLTLGGLAKLMGRI